MHVRYGIDVEEGRIAIGILSQDGSRFLEIRVLPGLGYHEGVLSAAVRSMDHVSIVLANSRLEDGQSSFLVSVLDIAPIKVGTTP